MQAIIEILKAALQEESTFAEAEVLYAESFKDSKTFKVADGFYDRETLVHFLMEDIYAPLPIDAPEWLEPEVIKEGWSFEKADALLDSLEFVELCNYKGEGEGFTLACRATKLRTFVSKHNYI